MSFDFQQRERVPVAILGATGSIGQKLLQLLAPHPWFEIVCVTGSERNLGKRLHETIPQTACLNLPQSILDLPIKESTSKLSCSLVFSALDSSIAGPIEEQHARAGLGVISAARYFRMDPQVPLIVPEVNLDHLELIKHQKFGKGYIITKPNCTVTGVVLALKPLFDRWGIEAFATTSLQALSGAGYPGVPSLDIIDNVIPFIGGEEERMEEEPQKIFGKRIDNKIDYQTFKISAQANRVPVVDGHTVCLSFKLGSKATENEIIEAWNHFESPLKGWNLSLAPEKPLQYVSIQDQPQPKTFKDYQKGMGVTIGRLRKCSLLDYKCVVLSHNTMRGGAGGAVLTAEILLKKGHVFW